MQDHQDDTADEGPHSDIIIFFFLFFFYNFSPLLHHYSIYYSNNYNISTLLKGLESLKDKILN